MCRLYKAGMYKAQVSRRSRINYNRRMHLSLESQVSYIIDEISNKANLTHATTTLLTYAISSFAYSFQSLILKQ